MRQLNPASDINRFWDRLRESSSAVLMLDYDGTLAPFVTDPARAVPYDGVRDRLQKLAAGSRTCLILISGRSIDDLVNLLGIDPLPELWGSHGLEHRRLDGEVVVLPDSTMTGRAREHIRIFAERHGIGDLTEFKKSGAAFHWRRLDSQTAHELRTELHHYWDDAAPRFGFEVHEFDGGLELRRAGVSKALAVRHIIDRSGPEVPAAFLGDDLTDEDGFRALGGRGLSVLVRPEFRETVADWWLVPPEELLWLLDCWLKNTENPDVD